VASIGISAPLTRFPRERYQIVGPQIAEAAKAITAILSAD